MRTDSQGYSDYLQAKYLPGRRLYLRWFFYPGILRHFRSTDLILDLGCGTGEFLNFCRTRKRDVIGVDSNEVLAQQCRDQGFDVLVDDVCKLSSLTGKCFENAVCDNVLEHLEPTELDCFFNRLETLLSPGGIFVCIVPGIRGFKCDPTHKTFVCDELLTRILRGRSLRLTDCYHHPLNVSHLDRFCYLNMQVFRIQKLA